MSGLCPSGYWATSRSGSPESRDSVLIGEHGHEPICVAIAPHIGLDVALRHGNAPSDIVCPGLFRLPVAIPVPAIHLAAIVVERRVLSGVHDVSAKNGVPAL